MLRQRVRLPDVDPAIAQTQATAATPLPAAMRAVAITIGAMVLIALVSADWSPLAKLGRSQPLEASAAAPLGPVQRP